MLVLSTIVLSLETLFLSSYLSFKVKNKFNPVSVMSYIWILFLLLSEISGSKMNYYPVDYQVVLIVFLFLNVILLTSYFFVSPYTDSQTIITKAVNNVFNVSDKGVYLLTIFCFVLYVTSQYFYFKNLSDFIPLNSIFYSIWRWKHLIITGELTGNSLLLIGRSVPAIGTIFAVNYLLNKNKKGKRIISFLILFFYLLLTFIYPQRDYMADRFIYVLCPFVVYYRGKVKFFLQWLLPIFLAFIFVFAFIQASLSFSDIMSLESLGAYTFASFNSLQMVIDYGYASNTDLLLGNTFYFVYMILKYISPILKPPDIILEFFGGSYNSVNVYTSLIAPFIDSNGNMLLFCFIVIVYGLYIGVVFALSMNIMQKKNDLPALIFFSAAYACSIRSFMNPTFSYGEMLITACFALFINVFFRFRKF